MKVDFFCAECRLCKGALSRIEHEFPKVEIEVHKASECVDGSCCALAEKYGVRAVPSLVVDGKVVLVGLPNNKDIESLSAILNA
jgi:predicted DsbA family dithiol-disulfide isomerase